MTPLKKPHQKHVVIVGAGFGGLFTARALAKKDEVHVTLIDRRNFHLFQPLLYQVATAGLNPADIAVPIRAQFSWAENIEVIMGEVENVSLNEKKIRTEDREISYDYLILACGARHSYFGKSEWEQFAPGLKTLEQAIEIRRRMLMAFEKAEKITDPKEQSALMTFVVVGGGPTGVELAGALADISHTVFVRDFSRIDTRKTRVILVEANKRLLSTFSEKTSERAAHDLHELGVETRLGAFVTHVDAGGISIGDEHIPARTVIWAAGVEQPKLNQTLGVPLDRGGRVIVGKDLSIPSHPEAFVIGDQAHCELEEGNPLPGLAPVAIQAGRWVGRNIISEIRGEARKPFRYVDKGTMATIGRRRAVLEMTGGIRMGGFLAWVGWLIVHLFFLIGFRNRVAVLAQWLWSYLLSKRGCRLITNREWRLF